MPITIKTQAGNKVITRERLEQLLKEGKVKPTTKAISVDDGATWITVEEALKLETEIEPLCRDQWVTDAQREIPRSSLPAMR